MYSVLKRYTMDKTIVIGVRLQEIDKNKPEQSYIRNLFGNLKSKDVNEQFNHGNIITKDANKTATKLEKPSEETKSLPQRSCNRQQLKEVAIVHNKNNRALRNNSKVQIQTKSFLCNVCNKPFTQENTLNRHMRLHSAVKSFRCDICNKSFTRKGILISHLQTHSEGKPFRCEVCDRPFSQKLRLDNHLLTHSGEKAFSCDVCVKSFSRKKDLVKHLLVHSAKTPFFCNICNKVFSRKNNLTIHGTAHSK